MTEAANTKPAPDLPLLRHYHELLATCSICSPEAPTKKPEGWHEDE